MPATTTTTFNDGTTTVTIGELTKMLNDRAISISGFWTHTKASEKYVIVSLANQSSTRKWYIPYYYRRTNLFIDTIGDLVTYIDDVIPFLYRSNITQFVKRTKSELIEVFGSGSNVTLPIFSQLLDNCGEWILNRDFDNPNSQRRIQDIKEKGYTVATKIEGRSTYHSLLPFPRVPAPTYETIPNDVRKAIFRALEGVDAFTGNPAPISALPDHKFPEIRWNADTAVSNENLSLAEMRKKFQLVTEVINQAKREVCRKCFQSGNRGKLNGIDFFYEGASKWPEDVPKIGPEAEKGCVGCFWYDMSKWRKELNERLRTRQ